MNLLQQCILPNWPAPKNVKSLQTTRNGGVSAAPYNSLNLGDHVGDTPLAVAHNRQLLASLLPSDPVWLKQVHGTEAVDVSHAACLPQADACVSSHPGAVCVVMTADCLPVLLCNDEGSVVGAAHAGWRGLCDGVIEQTVRGMKAPPETLMAWLGPAIGPQAFEVGDEVREAFVARQQEAVKAFAPSPPAPLDETTSHSTKLQKTAAKSLVIPPAGEGGASAPGEGKKWFADIYQLARLRLNALGISRIYGGGLCTYTDRARFFSYRRDGATGRMGTLIWLDK